MRLQQRSDNYSKDVITKNKDSVKNSVRGYLFKGTRCDIQLVILQENQILHVKN